MVKAEENAEAEVDEDEDVQKAGKEDEMYG